MNAKLNQLTLILVIFCATAVAQNTLSEPNSQGLPMEVYQTLEDSDFFSSYDIFKQMDPFLKYADFNGDGVTDFAIQIVHKHTKKRGILFLHGNDRNLFIIGAGADFASLGDNFTWLNWWRIDAQTLTSESLLLKHPDFPRALIYFDGRGYQFKSMDAITNYSAGPVYGLDIPQCLLRIPGLYISHDL